MDRRVAILGAGWAGLAAAVTLAERAVPVIVFESSRQLGGRARRVTLDGVELDNGQHILIGAYTETLRLMCTVGADPASLLLRMRFELRQTSGFRLSAAPLPSPFHLLVGLLCASGISWRERTAAARLLAAHRHTSYRLAHDESVAAWLARHRQSQTVRGAFWEPLCVAALNTPVTEASAQVFLSVLRDTIEGSRSASDLLLPRADLSALFPEPAARFVAARAGAIRLGSAVRGIASASDGFQLDGAEERFSHLIIACAPQHAASLVRSFPETETLAGQLEAFQYEPIYTCYLQYPESLSLPFPMLGLGGGYAQWVFDRGILSGHRGLLACVISGSGQHEALPQAELAKTLHAELARALPGLPSPLWSQVIAEKRATFSCRPALVRPGNATAIPRLILAGDYTASEYPATLESAVRSGVAAARLVR